MKKQVKAKDLKAAGVGKHSAGGGLYLVVKDGGSKSWIFRYTFGKSRKEMGLGALSDLGFDEAQDRAFELRRDVRAGKDPLAEKDRAKALEVASASKTMTFRECSERFISIHSVAWKSPRQRSIWESSLEMWAHPLIGSLPLREITRDMVAEIMTRMWNHKDKNGLPAPRHDSSFRVQARIENILKYAIALELRPAPNPAEWKGNLEYIMPKLELKVTHQPSLPREMLPEFFAGVWKASETAQRALSFLILTACRSGEVRGASWDEFDYDQGVWTIPAERMKARREHRVPLSKPALELVKFLRTRSESRYVFPGRVGGRPLSDMALLMIMRRSGQTTAVPHGFRSTFKDWASECTDFPNEVSEMALAHAVRDKTEAAYRRGDLFEKRRELMNEWATFCLGSKKLEQSADTL